MKKTVIKPVKPLVRGFDQYDLNALDDLLLVTARNIEEALINAGAKPNTDYSILDVFKLAAPFAQGLFERNVDKTHFISSFDS